MTEKEFLPAREKFMKDLITKKSQIRSIHSAFNWEQGKAWCVWETDTIERLQGVMAQFQNIHTDVIPVKLAPQIM
jgi:hypothetical protein